MKKIKIFISTLSILISFSHLQLAHSAENDIVGIGSSLSADVFQSWAKDFEKEYPGKVAITYKSASSGEGIRRITSRTVDFAVTDIPLTMSELSQDDLIQFPFLLAGVVPVINIPNIKINQMKLTPEVLTDIYLGKVKSWDDEQIKKINPSLNLPNIPIQVLYRQDGSGTSFVFTNYLSNISKEWNDHVGMGSKLLWPIGKGVKGTNGIKEAIQNQEGSISYIEYGVAKKNNLTTIQLKNTEGNFISPGEEKFREAANRATWTRASYYESLVNLKGENTWPIVAVSYVLVHKSKTDEQDIKDTLTFLDWAFHNGLKSAELNQVILIENAKLITKIENTWLEMRSDNNNPVWKLHGVTK